MSYVTPWSGQLEEGTYEVAMPSNVIVNGDTWNFKAQVDAITKEPISTNPITTVNLIADTALEYAYELLVLTAIQVHVFLDGQPVAAEGLIIETNQTFSIPQAGTTIEVPSGTYTIRVTVADVAPYQETVTIAEGQTIRIDAQLVSPTPIPPLAVATLVGIPVVGLILWVALKR